jgi:ACS family allantoate permease-like MFS transporter
MASVFFGAMLTVFPQSWLCQRFPTGKIFAINVTGFAIMTFATMGAKNVSHSLADVMLTVQAASLQAIRFILGMFEGLNTSGAGIVVSLRTVAYASYSTLTFLDLHVV